MNASKHQQLKLNKKRFITVTPANVYIKTNAALLA
jgi:hypothetical protein